MWEGCDARGSMLAMMAHMDSEHLGGIFTPELEELLRCADGQDEKKDSITSSRKQSADEDKKKKSEVYLFPPRTPEEALVQSLGSDALPWL